MAFLRAALNSWLVPTKMFAPECVGTGKPSRGTLFPTQSFRTSVRSPKGLQKRDM